MPRLVLMVEIALETLLLPEYTTSPEDLSAAKLPVPPVIDANERDPVKVGAALGAFKSSAVCVAVEMGFARSDVSFTLDRPTSDFVTLELYPGLM